MRIVTFTNSRGEKVQFDQGAGPFVLKRIKGTGGSDITTQTQKAPYQDGGTYIDSVSEERFIDLEVEILTNNEEELFQKRAYLLRVLNHKLGLGLLRYEYPGSTKEIVAITEELPDFPAGKENSGRDYQSTVFSLRCPNPFWYDPTEEEWTLASFEGGLSFPFSFPFNLGAVGKKVTVENKGDVDTPLFITFKGPLTNPVIENLTTGKKITVTKEILDGETLEINTEFGNKSISIIAVDGTRSNGFHYIDPTSELFQLISGENELSYASTASIGDAACSVKYKHRYIGV